MGDTQQSDAQLCGLDTYYVTEGETFDVNFSVPNGLPEGSYMFSMICMGADDSESDYCHRVCVIEVKDGVTAIGGISTPSADKDAPVYNLRGQRVTDGYKGITIRNGKKTLRK